MNIGEAAAASGISAKMIRHYEAIGLIAAGRGANHYRVYAQADIATLRFIRHARDLGFPLQDVKRLLNLWHNRARASAEVKRLALDHVAALEAKAKSLSAMAQSLRHLASHCRGDDWPNCPHTERAWTEGSPEMTETITLEVEGMSCGHCIRAVTNAIQGLDQAAKVEVDLATKRVVAQTSLPRADLVRAVEEEGFSVKG